MKRSAILLFMFGLCLGVSAQSVADSLRLKLKRAGSPQEKTRIIQSLGKALMVGAQYDSLYKYGEQLVNLSNQINDEKANLFGRALQAQSFMRSDSSRFFRESKLVLEDCQNKNYVPGIAITCLGLGSRLMNLGQYQQARHYLLTGYAAVDSSYQDWIGLKSDLIRTVSAVYHHQGMYTEALEYGLISNRHAEKSREPMQILKSYLNLSGLYGELSSPENGLGSEDDRLRYHREAKKYMMLSYTFSKANASKMTQGATAFNLGSLYGEDQQIDSSFLYLNTALRLGFETGFDELISNAYRAKGKFYSSNPDSAVWLLDQAALYAQKAKNPISVVGTLVDKARVLATQGAFSKAEIIATDALRQANQLRLLNEKRSALQILYEVNQKLNRHREALSWYQQFVSVRDSMVNEKNFAKIEELKTRYETELKDSAIKSLEQKSALQDLELKQRTLLLVAVLLVGLTTLALVVLFFQQRALKQQQHALQLENKFLRFQLDPHFIANALVSIQHFVLEQRTHEAAQYLSKFSRLMRQLLEYSREELITIEEEVDLLRNYLDLQKLRLKGKFEYSFRLDNELELAESKIPPMFAQPFVENAVEHGISSVDDGKIEIQFIKQGNQLIIVITDNGKGISMTTPSSKTSLSTKIIQERITLLNKTNQTPIQLTIGNAPNHSGTEVRITLPISS